MPRVGVAMPRRTSRISGGFPALPGAPAVCRRTCPRRDTRRLAIRGPAARQRAAGGGRLAACAIGTRPTLGRAGAGRFQPRHRLAQAAGTVATHWRHTVKLLTCREGRENGAAAPSPGRSATRNGTASQNNDASGRKSRTYRPGTGLSGCRTPTPDYGRVMPDVEPIV